MKNLNEQTIKKAIIKILKEGVLDANRKNVVKSAYNQIVVAVAGWGTNPDKVLNAINTLKSSDEFKYLLTFFKDKKTGYSDFATMINEEYDRFNFNDVIKLTNKLRLIGVRTEFEQGKNNAGMNQFYGKFKITRIISNDTQNILNSSKNIRVNSACTTKWQSQLPKAVSFWTNWLNNPITRKKAEKNWRDQSNFLSIYSGYYGISSSIAWSKYKDSLSNLKLVFYDYTMDYVGKQKTNDSAYAFVSYYSRYNIYINCSENDPDPYGSLIHEIQHIIYNIKPLNPAEKIRDAFVTSKTIKQTEQKIKTSLPDDKIKQYSPNVIQTAKKIGVKNDDIEYWKSRINDPNGKINEDPGYVCRETEKMSNVMSIRKTFNVGPGGNITYNMLKPYITQQKHNTDISWVLLCWAQNGFPDINQMLNKINQLAFNQNKKSNPSGTNVA